MFMNVTCPLCGHACRVSESALGQAVQCPACAKPFQCGTLSPRSLVTRPIADRPAAVHEVPSARAAEGRSEERIHYRCMRCNHALESPAHLAGTKIHCPSCNQRLQIPHASTPRPAEGSLLGAMQPSAVPVQVVGGPVPTVPPSPPAAPPQPVPTVIPVVVPPSAPAAPARVESCLECGTDLTNRARVQTCPDCGSIFCSAGCYREHRYHAHPSRR